MKGLLAKVLPVEKLLALAMRFGLLKAPLEALAKGWEKAEGARTQIAMVLAIVLAACAFFGVISWEQAEPMLQVLGGLAGAAFADKINRALPVAKKASAKVAEEAKKRKKG